MYYLREIVPLHNRYTYVINAIGIKQCAKLYFVMELEPMEIPQKKIGDILKQFAQENNKIDTRPFHNKKSNNR